MTSDPCGEQIDRPEDAVLRPASKNNDTSACISQHAIPRGICGHICAWLWSGWRGTAFHPPAKAPIQPSRNDPSDCKACRERHVACDRVKPQCSHCWQQQLLCFYVTPSRNITRREHRIKFASLGPKTVPVAHETQA